VQLPQRDWIAEPLQVLSYGGGVQSTAMLLMIKEGRIPKPDIVVHSDTGSELPETEEFIEWAYKFTITELKIPFVIVRATQGKLHEFYRSTAAIPVIGMRHCTKNFKIAPQRQFFRSIVGRRNKHMVDCWLGITTDEDRRRIDSDVKWCQNKFPLLDDLPTSRQECIEINAKYGLNVPKSGCWLCPYQGGLKWLALRENHPELFQYAMEMEEEKKAKWGGSIGLYQERPLKDLDEYVLPDSTCDSDAGCFI